MTDKNIARMEEWMNARYVPYIYLKMLNIELILKSNAHSVEENDSQPLWILIKNFGHKHVKWLTVKNDKAVIKIINTNK